MPRRSGRSGQRQHRDREQKSSVWGWPLPRDLRQALGGGVDSNLKTLLTRIKNPALLIQRYIAYPKEGRADQDYAQIFQEQEAKWLWKPGRRDYKNEAWRKIEDALGNLYQSIIPVWLKALHAREQALEEALNCNCYKTRSFPVTVVWRSVVGMGLPSPMEVGITLHRLYGFPYLPGSAIKGVTRSWRLQQIADELGIPRLNNQQINEWGEKYGPTPWKCLEQLLMSPGQSRWKQLEQTLKDKSLQMLREWGFFCGVAPQLPDLEEMKKEYIQDFPQIFGSTETRGNVVFFDAYPETLTVNGKSILELDIMNPHYREYYTEDKPKPPADYLSPEPVFFLTVRQGTTFLIRLASPHEKLLGTAENWVKKALKEFGLGAKTRAGYGELRRPGR